MKSSETNELVPLEPGDRPELDRLEAEHSRGTRIMVKVLIGWGLASVAVTGIAAALTTYGGPMGGISWGIFALAVVVYLVSRRRLGRLKQDLASGKLLIDAPIERKEVTGAGGRASVLQYFLHLEGRRFWVDAAAHDRVSEGDHVRFEYLPKSEIVLRITPTQDAVNRAR